MSSVDSRVAQGAAALARGDWTGARKHFEASLDREETTAALEGLSDALFWLEEIGPSIERRTRALPAASGGGRCLPRRSRGAVAGDELLLGARQWCGREWLAAAC